VSRDDAFALALLVHAMLLAVTSIGGLIAAWRLRVPPIRAKATPD
jgi:hypothetical protein